MGPPNFSASLAPRAKTTLTQQEAIEHIYSMSDEDIRLLIGFIERMKAGGK